MGICGDDGEVLCDGVWYGTMRFYFDSLFSHFVFGAGWLEHSETLLLTTAHGSGVVVEFCRWSSVLMVERSASYVGIRKVRRGLFIGGKWVLIFGSCRICTLTCFYFHYRGLKKLSKITTLN